MPEKVIIGECWARDGLQNETNIVSTDDKVKVINRLQQIGFKKIEATSFAHLKYLPQFSDAEEVLKRIDRQPGVDFRAIVANERGMRRCVEAVEKGYGVQEVALIVAASEAYNLSNVKMSHADNKPILENMCKMAREAGLNIIGWVLTAFGCAITGDVPLEKVRDWGRWWKEQGARYIGFGDTTGESNPLKTYRFFEYMQEAGFSPDEIIVHWHDTQGMGQANNLAALQCGMKYFDGSLGAMGGPPAIVGEKTYHAGFAGNCCTEDMVGMFEEMGVATGIDRNGLLEVGRLAESIVGRPLRSSVIHSSSTRNPEL